jgi:hypothetical protein
LNGVMPATTPSGWRIEYMSMPGPAPSENSPLMRWGTPMANSHTSTPRWMSPALSGTVLPCSSDSMRASSSLCWWMRSTNFIITRARTWAFLAAQPGCAAAAFSTALRISSLLARATFAWTSPVLGLKTSPNRPLWPLTSRPPMKCPISRMARAP